jgi:DNA-binding response OmpR family regulator
LLPVLFVTGFAEQDAFKGISERDIVRKPINVQELSTKLRASLAAHPRQAAQDGIQDGLSA